MPKEFRFRGLELCLMAKPCRHTDAGYRPVAHVGNGADAHGGPARLSVLRSGSRGPSPEAPTRHDR